MKLIGAVIVICVFAYGGIAAGKTMGRRCEFWERFITALQILRSEIGFSGSSLKKAFLNAARISGEPLFENAAAEIETVGIDRAWKAAVDRQPLCEEDKRTVLLLSGKLGKTDTEGQIKHLDYISGLAEEARSSADELYKRKGVLYRRGGLLAGIFVAVVLL